MLGGKIITTLALLALPALALAVSVGPLDGKAGPSLKPIGNPGGIEVEHLPDTGFPRELERMGDLSSASQEWLRLAYKSVGDEREEALTEATRLQIAMNRPDVAVRLLTELITENPSSEYAPEALFHLATGPQSEAQASALKQLQDKFATNPWGQAALLTDVWDQAKAGKIKQTYSLPQAEELKKRIKSLRRVQQERVAMAGAFGVVIPGAGHAYAGNMPQALTVFLVWCLFTLAFLSACRHRHYAYSFLFVIPAAALWLTSPVVAMQLVKDETQKKLEANLNSWNDLRPTPPKPGTNISS